MNFAFTPRLEGSISMKIDDELGRGAAGSVPVVRFYTWSGYAISVGRNQDPAKRLNLEYCRRDGLEVVRRPTGGKELLHGNDLCYSVVWPMSGSGGAVRAGDLFGRIGDILAAALRKFGLDVNLEAYKGRHRSVKGPCFVQVDRGEIAIRGKKLVASAQRVYANAILQQGSMPLFRPEIDLADYLTRFDRGRISEALAGRTACFFELTGETIALESIVDVFRGEFERRLEKEFGPRMGRLNEIKRDIGKTV